jgi:glycosyltransferase involved in cell wall biosynthesis
MAMGLARGGLSVLVGIAASAGLTGFLLLVEGACLWRTVLDRMGAGSLSAIDPSSRPRLRILVMGSFFNANWYRAHLIPLATSEAVAEVRVVSGVAGEAIRSVCWRVPPAWMRRLAGGNLSRGLMAAWQTLRWRPDVMMGYFIFPNALLALLLARLSGASAVYQMGGGPLEIQQCGSCSENTFLRRALPRFPGLHRMLMRVIGRFDLIVVRGQSARAYCRKHFPDTNVEIVTAGIDCERFRPMPEVEKRFDVVTVGRLSALKRVDVLIQALARVSRHLPELTAAIVGEGPERHNLERLCESLGLAGRVHFAGKSDKVELILNQSRLFVLCSDSEGFSIAMAEAMACGLPAVVSDVGELGALVRNGHTGRLVPRGDVAAFASAIEDLLRDGTALKSFSERCVREAGQMCSLPAVSRRWTCILRELAARRRVPARVWSAPASSKERGSCLL